VQETCNRDEESGILIEYEVYHHFWQTCFAKNDEDAERIVAGLKKLKHVTDIKGARSAKDGQG
jgi:predicted MarR family transcription regulator